MAASAVRVITSGWSLQTWSSRPKRQESLLQEAAFQRCSKQKVFWKYAATLQENTHTELWFQ